MVITVIVVALFTLILFNIIGLELAENGVQLLFLLIFDILVLASMCYVVYRLT